jgi:hypothetical protein
MRTLAADSRRKAPRRGSKRDPLRRPGPTDKPPTKRQLGNIRSLEKRLGGGSGQMSCSSTSTGIVARVPGSIALSVEASSFAR